jgi:hypothetical protein
VATARRVTPCSRWGWSRAKRASAPARSSSASAVRRVALLGSEHPRALALADEALRLAYDEGFQHLIPRAAVVCGQAQAGLGDDRAAAESFTQALECDLAFAHSARVAADAVALAAIRQAQGDGVGAIGLLVPQLTLLLSGALTGMDEPMRTLLSAAETLRAAGDPRAEQLVARAERELARRAELVHPERRDAFLCAVLAHRALTNVAKTVGI